MKCFVTALIALSIAFTTPTYAQSIPNASFENWTPLVSTFYTPDHWLGINSVVSRGTPGFTGSYFLDLTNSVTDIAFTQTTNYDYLADTGTAGFACPYKPSCLSGSYQYNITGSDSALIEIMLYRGYLSTYGAPTTLCGLGVLYITAGSISTWTDFSVPITYLPPYDTPDSATITLAASCNRNSANTVAGNSLYIDNLHFCTSSQVNTLAGSQPIEIYPNPVINELNVKGDIPTDAVIKICNCLGQTVFEGKGAHTIDTRNMPAGIYWINISGSNNEVLKRAQIVKE